MKLPVPRKQPKEYPVGSVFNPHLIQSPDYRVQFEYEPGSYFEVYLNKDGTLNIRLSGANSDMLATHHNVANNAMLVPRRYSNELNRYVELIKEGSNA